MNYTKIAPFDYGSGDGYADHFRLICEMFEQVGAIYVPTNGDVDDLNNVEPPPDFGPITDGYSHRVYLLKFGDDDLYVRIGTYRSHNYTASSVRVNTTFQIGSSADINGSITNPILVSALTDATGSSTNISQPAPVSTIHQSYSALTDQSFSLCLYDRIAPPWNNRLNTHCYSFFHIYKSETGFVVVRPSPITGGTHRSDLAYYIVHNNEIHVRYTACAVLSDEYGASHGGIVNAYRHKYIIDEEVFEIPTVVAISSSITSPMNFNLADGHGNTRKFFYPGEVCTPGAMTRQNVHPGALAFQWE